MVVACHSGLPRPMVAEFSEMPPTSAASGKAPVSIEDKFFLCSADAKRGFRSPL